MYSIILSGNLTMKEDILKKILGVIPTPAIVLKADPPSFTIAFLNKAYEELAHHSIEEITGKGFFEMFPEMQGSEIIRENLHEVLSKKDKIETPLIKYWFNGRDIFNNEIKYFSTINTPIFNDNLEVEYILRTVNDVSDSVALTTNEIILGKAGIDMFEFNVVSKEIMWQENNNGFFNIERDKIDKLIRNSISGIIEDYSSNKKNKYFSFEEIISVEDNPGKKVKLSIKIIDSHQKEIVKIIGAAMDLSVEDKILSSKEPSYKNFKHFHIDIFGNFLKNDSAFIIELDSDLSKSEYNIFNYLLPYSKVILMELIEKAVAEPLLKFQAAVDFNANGTLTSYYFEVIFHRSLKGKKNVIECTASKLAEFDGSTKATTEALRKAKLNSGVNSIVLDMDVKTDNCIWLPDFFDFFGLKNQPQFNLNIWRSLVNNYDGERLHKSLQEAFKNKDQIKWYGSYRLIMPDSSFVFVEFIGFIIRNKSGEAINFIGTLKDISRQKLNETQLKLLESFIQNSNDAVMISEPDETDLFKHRIIYVNEAFVNMTGWSSEESIGQHPDLFEGVEKNTLTFKHIENHVIKRKYLKIEIPYKKKSGVKGWASLSMHPVFSDNGIFTNWVCIADDITEKKEAQLHLAYKSKLIETIAFVNSNLLQHQKFLEVMKTCFKVVGEVANAHSVYYFELVKNENNRKFFHKRLEWSSDGKRSITEDEMYPRSLLKQFLPELLLNNYSSGVTETLENSAFKDLLQNLNVKSFLLFPLFVQKKLYGIIGFDDCTDGRVWTEDEISFLKTISLNFSAAIERQIANENLENAYKEKENTIESLQDGFFSISHKGIITFWNEEAENISKLSKDYIIGKKFHDVFKDKLSEQLLKYYKSPWKEIGSIRAEEFFPEIDKWLEISVFLTEAGISGYFKDVTHRKLGEKKLTDLHKELKTNLKELSFTNLQLEQFAYIASHDLQEPLRMVTSFLTLLEKKYGDVLDEKGKKYIFHAVDGAKRMRQIIFDLLEYSRVGHIEGHKENVNISNMINDIKVLYSQKIEEANAEIHVQEMPLIKTYTAPLQQIFQNLIGNSLKYKHPERNAIISVRNRPNKNYWLFEVADNGIGINSDYYDKIFLIFQRLHNKDLPGTGLGLAIVKKIIESLGGKIWVKSKEGDGSNFYFTIPK